MKKILALLCALCMLAVITPVLAEGAAPDLSGVYLLAGVNEAGDFTFLGTGVLLGDQYTLITTRWATETEDTLVAIGEGGTLLMQGKEILQQGSDMVRLTLATASPAKPMTLGEIEPDMTCVGLTDQSLTECTALHTTLTVYEDEASLLYTGVKGMKPGAVLINSKGEVAGIASAKYGEGRNRYVAWTFDRIAAMMKGEADAPKSFRWLSGMTAAAEDGVVNLDWSAVEKPENAAESRFYLVWQDMANNFVFYSPVEDWDKHSGVLGYVPGHVYQFGLQQSTDGEVHLGEDAAPMVSTVCITEKTESFDKYSFRDTSIYLGAAPADQLPAAGEAVPALETINRETLMAENTCYYLQVNSTYQVTEEVDTTLVIALTAPDGSTYTYLGGFIFAPELQKGDCWNADITAILQACMGTTGGMSGQYSLAYYLGGQLASEFTFTLE